MKKSFLAAVLMTATLAGSFTMQSCERVKEAVEDVSIPAPFPISFSFEEEIPFATFATPDLLPYPPINLNVDVDQLIKEQYPAFGANNIKEAYLQNFKVEYISSMLGTKLDIIKDAEIYLKTPDLPPVLVAKVTGNTSQDKIDFTAYVS